MIPSESPAGRTPRQALDALPRQRLTFLPTPLAPLARLSAALGGPELWIKRDDQTGLATGGNKSRKLEFLVGAALAGGHDTLLTAGAAQSNHCRQTAAAAAASGLACVLVLGGEEPELAEGNVLLDRLFGAEIHWTPGARRGERLAALAHTLAAQGRRPYVIPYGGSNEVGAAGYLLAAAELASQMESAALKFDRIFVASSSGGTLAGLLAGQRAFAFSGRLSAVLIDAEAPAGSHAARVAALANRTVRGLGWSGASRAEEMDVWESFLGAGYGIVGSLEREAIQRLARAEGILLDPVYTARAFGALLALIDRGDIGRDERVLFWHTGGTPALFPYGPALLEDRTR